MIDARECSRNRRGMFFNFRLSWGDRCGIPRLMTMLVVLVPLPVLPHLTPTDVNRGRRTMAFRKPIPTHCARLPVWEHQSPTTNTGHG